MKKNKKQMTINSNWTADKPVEGWRHYRISGRYYEDGTLWLELMSVCDRAVVVRIEADVFAGDKNWLSGWK